MHHLTPARNAVTISKSKLKHLAFPNTQNSKKTTKFLSNYDFNIKICPDCSSKLLITDSFCYNCGADVVNAEKTLTKPKKTRMTKHLKFKRTTRFLSNYDFNLKICPKCNSKLLKDDSFCYNCGDKLTTE